MRLYAGVTLKTASVFISRRRILASSIHVLFVPVQASFPNHSVAEHQLKQLGESITGFRDVSVALNNLPMNRKFIVTSFNWNTKQCQRPDPHQWSEMSILSKLYISWRLDGRSQL